MNEPIPPRDQNAPQDDANRMLGQVVKAFNLPWPRKPLSDHKGAVKVPGKGGKGGRGVPPWGARGRTGKARTKKQGHGMGYLD